MAQAGSSSLRGGTLPKLERKVHSMPSVARYRSVSRWTQSAPGDGFLPSNFFFTTGYRQRDACRVEQGSLML